MDTESTSTWASCESNTTEEDTTEEDTTEVNTTEVNTTEVNTTEVNTTEVNTTEVNTTEVNTTEVNTTEVNTTEVNTTEVNTSEEDESIPAVDVVVDGVAIVVEPPSNVTQMAQNHLAPNPSLLKGSRTERLKEQGKQGVDQKELINQIREITNLNGISDQLSDEILTEMTREIFKAANLNSDRHLLTFEQFTSIMNDIDSNILEMKSPEKELRKQNLSFYFFNKKLVRFVVFLVILMIAAFVWYFAIYGQKTNSVALYSWSLPIAKGSAQVIKLCLVLLTLTGTKRVVTYLRNVSCLTAVLPSNHLTTVHKYLGIVVCIASLIHVICHAVNIKNVTDTSRLSEWLSVNPGKKQPTVGDMFSSYVSITGIVLFLLLFIAVPFAVSLPNSYLATKFKIFESYDKFAVTHQLLIIFLIVACVHPLPAFPFSNNGAFFDQKANTLWWLIVPLMLYFHERITRFIRGKFPVKVNSFEVYSKKVLELKLSKPKWFATPKCGQYILLRDNTINGEWHPFTLTSCPEDDFLMVHIKPAGDWTSALLQKYWEKSCLPNFENEPKTCGRICIDGPFAAPAEDIHSRFSSCILIGIGIGSTPFVSAARSLLFSANGKRNTHITKLDMVLVSQDVPSIAWLKTGLNNLNFEGIEKIDITISVYLTCAKGLLGSNTPGSQFFNFGHKSLYSKTGKDILTGFNVETRFGRPDWNDLLNSARQDKVAGQIGVFACGPDQVTEILQKTCNDYSTREVSFKFVKEVF